MGNIVPNTAKSQPSKAQRSDTCPYCGEMVTGKWQTHPIWGASVISHCPHAWAASDCERYNAKYSDKEKPAIG
jgi:hypothetical protein